MALPPDLEEYVKEDSCSRILKSPNNKRSYKHITLPNGLRVMLVADLHGRSGEKKSNKNNEEMSVDDSSNNSASERSDDSADDKDEDDDDSVPKESAAALCVNVGSLENTEEIPGLAHLLEHVIFMGNQKYPEENGLDAFVASRSGTSNASTYHQRTVYEVEVPKKHLQEALTRFAYCFINPLLRKESIQQEVNPVDTEFLEGLSNDDSRLEQFFTTYVKSGHPLGNFSWGNRKSLITDTEKNGVDLRQGLVNFWKRYYLAEKMVLVVQSQETFETLEKWIQVFSEIPSAVNRKMPPERKPALPYDQKKFHGLYYVKPILDFHRLLISWSIPSQLAFYKTKPMSHVGSLIGHEAKGGLISVLRKLGLATGLSAGNDETDSDHNIHHAIFSIDISLTQLGLEKILEVVKYVAGYLQMLRSAGPQADFFEEEMEIELIKIKYEDEVCALAAVTSIAKNMFVYPEEDYRYLLVGSTLFLEYDELVIANCLDELTLDKANFVVMSPNVLREKDYKHREPWMDIRYNVVPVPSLWLAAPQEETVACFKLPEKNEFIPKNFNIVTESATEYPERIVADPMYNLWFKRDDLFKIPKSHINFALLSTHHKKCAKTAACLDLFIEILSINLSEEVYPADLAGLVYAIYVSDIGLIVTAEGFSEVLPRLVYMLVQHLKDFEIDDQTFMSMKENLSQNYFNSFKDSHKLAKSIRYAIFEPVYHTPIEKRKVLPQVTKEDVLRVHEEFFSELFMEILIQGNITRSKAEKIAENVCNKLDFEYPDKDRLPKLRVNSLNHELQTYCRVKSFCNTEKNSLVTNYYQIGPCDIKNFCRLDLLGNYMYEPAFDELRTKQGLGYNVSAQHHDTFGIGGYSVTVNSPADKFSCSEIDAKIETFLNFFALQISRMTEEEYESLRNGRIITKSGPDLHLKEEADRNWDEIISFNFCFSRLKKEVAFLEKISMLEFKRWAIEQLKSCSRRKLSVQVVGNGSEVDKEDGFSHEGASTSTNGFAKFGESEFSMDHDSKSEDGPFEVSYSLKYLRPIVAERNKFFVQEIDSFKKPLIAFPVTTVSN